MAICLITDFGTRDPYVAAMKGVIVSRTATPVIDCTHEIAPFDAWEAAFFLRDVFPYWADGTIFVVVVDPGVGTPRRILAVESQGKTVLAPDNGVLHFIHGVARSVENDALFLPKGSTTFHGRDRFAPVAAALANGAPVETVGPEAMERIALPYAPPRENRGTIIRIDRFGNAVTDLRAPATSGRQPSLRMAGGAIVSRWSSTYEGEGPLLIIGSTGGIEIAIPQASAAAVLHLERGQWIEWVTA